MRVAPLMAALITCAAVIWMVSFGPKYGRLYTDDDRAQPFATSDLGHGAGAAPDRRLNAAG